MENFFSDYKYLIVPFFVWLGLQVLKVILYKYKTKEWNWHRITGAGGLISSHSAVSTTLATMVGKNVGIKSPLFALSALFTFIVMYDAAGIRRNVGQQAKILNEMNEEKLEKNKNTNIKKLDTDEIAINDNNEFKYVKLQEMTGHTPIQVFLGWLVGFIVGILF